MGEAIEVVISRAGWGAALVLVNENVPPADVADPVDWRSELVGRYSTVSGFLKLLPTVISFGAHAQGYPIQEDMARLSPFVNRHLGVHGGAYSFVLPDLAPGAIRELRDPDAPDDDEDEV